MFWLSSQKLRKEIAEKEAQLRELAFRRKRLIKGKTDSMELFLLDSQMASLVSEIDALYEELQRDEE